MKVYYGWSNKWRDTGTSGGIVSHIAEDIIKQSGCVFGAAFDDNWHLSHIEISNVEEIHKISKSKYIQSELGTTIRRIQDELSKNHKVMFCGTPCQAYAVKTSCKSDENLILVDFVCHGVPSPRLFNDYLLKKSKNINTVAYDFRSKHRGWEHITVEHRKAGTKVKYKKGILDEFYYLFANSISLRNSCFDCPFKSEHFTDITVADYWKLPKEDADTDSFEKGVSLICTWNNKGNKLISRSEDLTVYEIDRDRADYAFESDSNIYEKKKTALQFYEDYSDYGYAYVEKKYASHVFLRTVLSILKNRIKS